MVGSYSPHSDAGGTLHLPSPTHIHHVDPALAFKQLRRSLSRSPSKVPTFRLVTSKSASPSLPSSPLSPPRDHAPNRSISATILPTTNVNSPSPLNTPSQSCSRKTRTPTRRLSPMRNTPRQAGAPRSPRKRLLSESTNAGNIAPRSSASSSDDQENSLEGSLSPPEYPLGGKQFKGTVCPLQSHSPLPVPRATARFEKGYGSWGAKSSPLKRSDGIMNLDQASGGSPSAKRRSLHGGIFGPDFNIFDHEASFEGPPDTPMTGTDASHESVHFEDQHSPLPKRTSSLRKSTLQQRHEKPLFAKTKHNNDISLDFSSPVQQSQQAVQKTRIRMSLDGALPSMPRDSPFSSQGGLPSASAHPISHHENSQSSSNNPAQPAQLSRHPLSRTISQSTSTSSMAEDSPTHIPIRQPEYRKPFMDFSKSLPMGSIRPGTKGTGSSSQVSSGASFATPENYKLVKPLPAAFMSTGLISKRHKNVDEQPSFGASTSTMPDTPCKRHSLAEIPSPTNQPQESYPKSHQIRHSFGTPSTPLNPHTIHSSNSSFGKGVNIFGSSLGHGVLQKCPSFVSDNGDEQFQSPTARGDSQCSADFDIPPTPTKQVLASTGRHSVSFQSVTDHQIHVTPGFNGGVSLNQSPQNAQNCKLLIPVASVDMAKRPCSAHSTAQGLRGFSTMPLSFTTSRLLRNSKSPAPLKKSSFSTSSLASQRSQAKLTLLSPASPLEKQIQHLSPRTPREMMIPPDPSGLSISNQADEQFRSLDDIANGAGNASVYPPATPTAPRGSFAAFGKSSLNMTPSHHSTPVTAEFDPVLTSKFDKVDLIGTGEFSQVYRVTKRQELSNSRSYFSIPLVARASPKTPLPDRVWAVKKSRHAYIGPKDRQRKLQEVRTLRKLGQSDHTVELVDSWEDKNHLYIQTEFCEEGSLDSFLDQVGRNARLDDFRIWKIMLEMAMGLKHIHDSGFIHLDLKPANILITFEGVLKIADFGMATQWPAPPGIDGEGDREYIGPEILRGQFDKPADVFALGLIVLEIAGNVMLPDNGASWQRLRTGDMSDVPSLTWSSDSINIIRDSSGKPLSQTQSTDEFYKSGSIADDFDTPRFLGHQRPMKNTPAHLHRSGELARPPSFMSDQDHPEALDNIVRWMISPESPDRPVVDQILATYGVQWADARRRAGATIFEGNWGPADEVLADDAEMIDV